MQEKICSVCGCAKPFSEYYKDKRGAFGLYAKCKSCHNIATQRWKDRNPEAVRESSRIYSLNNKDKIAEIGRKWAAENKDRIRSNRKANYDSKPEYFRAKTNRGRANNLEAYRQRDRESYYADHQRSLERQREHKRRNPSLFKKHELMRKYAREQATPAWANQFFIDEAYRLARLREIVCGGKWDVDHIVPLRSKVVCGLHCEANLQVIPRPLNQSKGNKYWPDMP